MIRDKNIICISSIDWDFLWQGHQEIASALAENNNRVLFIENTGVRSPGIRDIPRMRNRIRNWMKGVGGIRKERDNLYIFSPLVLPFPYWKIAQWINRYLVLSVLERWIRVMDFSDPIIWTYLPTPLSLDIIDNIVKQLIVYYCIDDFSSSSFSARKVLRSEKKLLETADLVFVTSQALYDYCSRYSTNVHLFPFAVNFEKFEQVRLNDTAVPQELRSLTRPIVGYVGGIHKWIDQKLLRATAERHPSHSFVFVGPLQTDISMVAGLKNVFFLGSKSHDHVPRFIKNFDVCIIPYSITHYTKNIYPTKMNEYLAMGKAVVSTNLPEIAQFNGTYEGSVYIAQSEKEFGGLIEKALAEDSDDARKRRIAAAKENSWANRIHRMSDLMEAAEIDRKKSNRDEQWKENLIVLFRKARRRAASVIGGILVAYLLLFKTPLLWFAALPLKISDAPRKADVIVVFGGGVGETGSPGKSTIERARFAAGLYRQGYADNIVFSSGYVYTYNDAENMRLIALSAGVPDEKIVLETKGDITYKNVIFSKDIVDKKGWHSILLISSPYNMRRAQFVFHKWAKDIKVWYVPVQRCQFYDRRQGVRLEQMLAIIHEYLGIIYYWYKGYY